MIRHDECSVLGAHVLYTANRCASSNLGKRAFVSDKWIRSQPFTSIMSIWNQSSIQVLHMKDKKLVQKQFKFKKVSVHSSVSNPYTNKSYVRYAFLIEKLLRSLSLAIIGIHQRVFEQTMCTFSLVHRKPLYFVSNACYIYIYIWWSRYAFTLSWV